MLVATRRWPLVVLMGGLLAIGVVGCTGSGGQGGQPRRGNAASLDGPNMVHMDNTRFVPAATTIRAGESLMLVADTMVPHIIANGTWANGSARRAVEPGAPEIKDVTIEGNSSGSVGPFNQPGTYNLYCTLHPGMNLTVTVVQG
jgi:plastocyanin